MSDLVCEFENEVNVGRKVRVYGGITKQKFLSGNETYVLYNCADVMTMSSDEEDELISSLSKSIKLFVGNAKKVLVVGLGNKDISSDSLGTETLGRVIATRGLIESRCEVSVLTPGVFGLTGIESVDIIKSVANLVKPNVIIMVDSLCANNYKNLVNRFQISNAGFEPGAGVGNYRKVANINTPNCKTITIGVPLVVYAKSFVNTAVDSVMQTTMHSTKNKHNIAIFNEFQKLRFDNIVLTVKDVDLCVKKLGYIISSAINLACNGYDVLEQKLILGK